MERQISLRLPGAILAEIDRRARRGHRRRSEVLRDAVEAYLGLPDDAFDRPLAALVPELIGRLRGLPSDLAARPAAYLRDLGRDRR